MNYAIGEILCSGMTFHPGTSMHRTTAESPAEVSHEVCDWQNCFFVLRSGGAMIEVSHERFNWLKIRKKRE